MQTTDSASHSAAENIEPIEESVNADSPASLRSRWARFLGTILPAPSPDRLVRVAQVGRTSLPLARGSLADADLSPVIQETTTMHGDSRFTILVSARDSETAAAVLTGL